MFQAVLVAALAIAATGAGGGDGCEEGCSGGIGCAQEACQDIGRCSLRINEIRVRDEEYFEIRGVPGTPLAGLTYVVLGDNTESFNSGIIEAAIPLDTLTIPPDGHLLVADPDSELNGDLSIQLDFEENDNLTHLLVEEFTGEVGDDLDQPDDGILDIKPWRVVRHAVVLLESHDSGDFYYPLDGLNGRALLVGPDYISETSPSHFYIGHRFQPDEDHDTGPLGCNWGASIGPTDYAPMVDSPGSPNVLARYEWCRSDVDLNGVVDDADLVSVQLAITDGSTCGWREDIDANGCIEFADLLAILSTFGHQCLPGDYNGDGVVDCADRIYLDEHWPIEKDGGCGVGCRGDYNGRGGRDKDDTSELHCDSSDSGF
jgi:hypothetical protein